MFHATYIPNKKPDLRFFLVLALILLPFQVSAGTADSYCEKASENLSGKEYSEAVSNYTAAIRLDPSGQCGTGILGKAYAGRGLALKELQQYGEAIADLNKAVELNPWDTSFSENLNESKKLKSKAELFHLAVLVAVVVIGFFLLMALYSFVRSKSAGAAKESSSSREKSISVAKKNPALSMAKDRIEAAVMKSFKTMDDYRAWLAVKEIMGKGNYREALGRYLGRDPGSLAEPDRINLFEIRLNLGDVDIAGNIYEEIRNSPILKEDIDLREKLSQLCAAKGLDVMSGWPENKGGRSRSKDELTDKAGALVQSGEYSGALDVLSNKPVTALTLDDYDLFFESYVRLGDLVRADFTLKNIKKLIFSEFPVRRDLERVIFKCDPNRTIDVDIVFYDSMAQLCMKLNWSDIASGLYRLIENIMLNTMKISGNQEDFYKLALSFELVRDFKYAMEVYMLMIEAGDYKDIRDRYVKITFHEQKPADSNRRKPEELKNRLDVSGAVLGGKYELKRILGEGGMAVVYEAWDREKKLTVAIKRMHSSLRTYPEEYARFRREAEIVQKLRHTAIVGVQAIVEDGLDVYLVFDYVDGKPLSEVLLEKKRLPLDECRRIFKNVCQAITYAHSSNIIHRDLKPANIMIGFKGEVKLMDFGLASELRDNSSQVSHQTKSGTPAYMAPEQYSGLVRRETDIYGMGLCLYEMLTGERAFTGPDYQDLKNKKDYRQATAVAPWLPAGIDKVINRALEPDPSMRFDTPMAFYKALMEI